MEELTGLLESGIHFTPVSSINSFLIWLKLGAIPCLQPVVRIPCCQAQHCVPSREPQQQHWTFGASSCRKAPSHLQVLWFGRCFQVAMALRVFGPTTGSLVASQELVATAAGGLPEG